MYVRAFRVGSNLTVLAAMNEGRIAIARFEPPQLVGVIVTSRPVPGKAFDLSADGTLIITGYDRTKCVEMWSTASCERVQSMTGFEGARVMFNASTTQVLAWNLISLKKTPGCIFELSTGRRTAFGQGKVGDLYGAAIEPQTKATLVPHATQAGIFRIRHSPLEIDLSPTPHPACCYTIRWSPDQSRVITLYEDVSVITQTQPQSIS